MAMDDRQKKQAVVLAVLVVALAGVWYWVLFGGAATSGGGGGPSADIAGDGASDAGQAGEEEGEAETADGAGSTAEPPTVQEALAATLPTFQKPKKVKALKAVKKTVRSENQTLANDRTKKPKDALQTVENTIRNKGLSDRLDAVTTGRRVRLVPPKSLDPKATEVLLSEARKLLAKEPGPVPADSKIFKRPRADGAQDQTSGESPQKGTKPSSESFESAAAKVAARLSLSAILWDRERPRAVIDGQVVAPGDRVEEGVRVKTIQRKFVTLALRHQGTVHPLNLWLRPRDTS